MSITVTGRQLEITAAIRERAESRLEPLMADATVKAGSASVVISRSKNRFEVSLIVNCKYHTIKSEVEDFDLYKAIDAAVDKAGSQLKVLHDKIHEHKAVPLCDSEAAKAAEASGTE